MKEIVKVKGKKFRIKKSSRKNKQLVAEPLGKGKPVHFGDPDMPEYPGTERGNNYCARSLGIAKQHDIKGDTSSPNFWSRKYLWNCKGKKSKKRDLI